MHTRSPNCVFLIKFPLCWNSSHAVQVFIHAMSLFRFLTVHGSADKTIPVEDAHEFVKHIPNHKLHVIEGANHNYTAHRNEVADAVVDFLTSNGV